ncbi:hypothetical protein PP633_06245 [Mycobacteroides abscessus]|uniref:hypothetical protein n=1 Tax=Mycobacteroides abscessus TaxID=36809 RepID=UPI0005DF35EE|nr:hypothetical protein [Mycobacteroides abscessus]MDM2642438.1 hypothetical protein [Mycobacteroides abscessus]MDM2652239.1 hypothetical protein [Mycobacteroides abscessus]MDM2662854.1 hypothetical protein [Mycobacteroides abscessus]MDM2667962.1 hypothetical protein [Mycobacteroides abscessus]MDM2673334.1 hypothetical protein [Mycobacteroides abscessus]
MYYLVKPDATVLWSEISEYMIDTLVKENPDFNVDYSRFDWKPAERLFDAGLLNIALRYGARTRDGIAVAGKHLVELDHFLTMRAIVRKELVRDSTNVPHAELFERVWPGWKDSMRELDQNVLKSQHANYERAQRDMLEAFETPIKPLLAEHWEILGGSIPPSVSV